MMPAMLFDVGGVDVTIPEWIKSKNFLVATSIEQVRRYVDEAIAVGICALDLEAEGLDNRVYHSPITSRYETKHKIVGFCLCKDKQSAIYIPVRHVEGSECNLDPALVEKEIVRLGEKTVLIFHHAKFDMEFLEFMGTPLIIPKYTGFECTLIADYVLNPSAREHGLKSLSREKLGLKMIELKELFPPKTKKLNFSLISPKNQGVREYGCSDAFCTFMLWDLYKDKIVDVGRAKYSLIYGLEKRLTYALRRQERSRILIDLKLIQELKRGAEDERESYARKFIEAATPYLKPDETQIDIASPAQLSDLLYKRMGIPIPEGAGEKGKTDMVSTDADTIESIVEDHVGKYPILEYIIQYRTMETVLTKVLDPISKNLDANHEARVGFNPCRADTGRLSCPGGKPDQGYTGANFHGIPKTKDNTKPLYSRRIREAIVARPGFAIVKIDFSGEELRIITNLAMERKWIKEFNEGSGDLHTLMALELFGTLEGNARNNAKTTNFAIAYGGGPGAVSRNTGMPKHESKRIIDKYFKQLPDFCKWTETQKELARNEHIVYTALGRPLPLPMMTDPDKKVRSGGERKAVNSPVQGTGADVIKYAMARIDGVLMERGWYPDKARMILNVHDEIVFEIRFELLEEAVPLFCDLMTEISKKIFKWKVHLEAEPLIGKSWAAELDWNKMKLGKVPVPEWLAPYFKVDGVVSGVTKREGAVSLISKNEVVPAPNVAETKSLGLNSLSLPESFSYILHRPLSDSTLILLRSVCKLSEIPSISNFKTKLSVSTINGMIVVPEEMGIKVDVCKFRVLSELYGL
jgi:DNA polymerase-1